MTDPLRVLLVHDVLGDQGGAEANVHLVGSGLRARGCEVSLLHGPPTGSGEEKFREAFSRRFDWSARSWRTALSESLGWRPHVVFVHKLANLGVLRGLVSSNLPLVRMVHDHDMYCQRSSRYFPWNRRICRRKAGYACAVTCTVLRNRQGVFPLRLAWPGRKMAELELCRRFRRHVVVTGFMKDELVLHDFDPDKITILPPVPRAAPPGYQPTYAEPVLLFVGQIIRGKGLDVLLRSLPLLRTPGWRCVAVGDGGQRKAVERLTGKLGLGARVYFAGWVEQQALPHFYRTARVGVVSSVWPEPIATIGLEFMQHALPVVSFDVGGIRDWLKDGENGYLVPLWDLAGLAGTLDRLLVDPERARRMGEDGLAKARRWHDHGQYLRQLHELLAQEARASG